VRQRTIPENKPTSAIFEAALKDLAATPAAVRLPTWFRFNEITGGLRPREFTILCGSTGSGKTTWLTNLSAQLLKGGVKHFVMNVETGPVDFMRRLLSVLEGRDLNTGDPISDEEVMKLAVKHSDLMLRELITFSTAEDRTDHVVLMDHLREMAAQGCKVAFIDNLNFLLEVVSANRQLEYMDRVTHDLIMLSKEIDLHVILVMHPKKTVNGRVESEQDIKGSSTAVQEAHNVLLFNRPPKDGPSQHPGNRELLIAKLRRRGKYVGTRLNYACIESLYIEQGVV
jgi:twinkle protein